MLTNKVLRLNRDELRTPAIPVTQESIAYVIQAVVPKMIEVMRKEKGLGLAANQIGDIHQVFVLEMEGEQPQTFINPEVLEESDLVDHVEACLSIPGTSATVKRFNKLKLRYLDESMTSQEVSLEGIKAIAVQHEVDHLSGLLYIDHLGDTSRMFCLNKHKKFVKFSSRMR